MSFFKTVLALLLLMVAGVRLSAQCGTISFTTPSVEGDNAVFEVWYSTPPATIYALDLSISLGSATRISEAGTTNFTAEYSSVTQRVRILKATGSPTPINTSGSFKLCEITISLDPCASTDLCLFTGSGGVQRLAVGGICTPANLGSTCLPYTMPCVTISGNIIKIPTSSDMEDVTVNVIPLTGSPRNAQTDDQGDFSVSLISSASYQATAERTDASSQCGIGEYDITLAQRVILNYDVFDHPYEAIAADVNRSGSLTTFDLIKMQQVILSSSNHFTQDWEFIPTNLYSGIAMPTDPYETPTYSTIMTAYSGSGNNFYAIKYGDVDGSGSSCAATSSLTPNAGNKKFKLGKAAPQNDETVLIPVYGKQFEQEMLFSLGLYLDPNKMEILGVKTGALPEFSDTSYAFDPNKPGLLNILWMNTQSKSGISIKSNEALFFIQARLLDGNTKIASNTVSLNYDRLLNLAFNAKSNKAEAIGLEYEEIGNGDDLLGQVKLISKESVKMISPNPFKDKLNLNIESPIAGSGLLQLLAQDGRLLRSLKIELVAGQNNLNVDQLDALPRGIIFYQLVLANQVLSGKLIKE